MVGPAGARRRDGPDGGRGLRRDRARLGPRASGGLRRCAARSDGRGDAGGRARRVRVSGRRRDRGASRNARVPPGARARDRGVLQRLRRRPASTRRVRGRRSTSTLPSPRAWRRTGPTSGSDERRRLGAGDDRAVRRRRRRLRRGRRGRGRRARRQRPARAAARARTAQDCGRLHALGGEGDARSLVADPVRADRRRRRRRDAAARPGVASVARRRSTPRSRCARTTKDYAKWHEAGGLVGAGGVTVRPVRPRRRTTIASRVRLGVRERTDWRKSVRTVEPGFRALGSALRAGAVVHRRELHELWLVSSGLPDERGQVDAQHVHPRRLGGRQARATCRRARRAHRDRVRRGNRGRVRRRRRDAPCVSTRAWSSSPRER